MHIIIYYKIQYSEDNKTWKNTFGKRGKYSIDTFDKAIDALCVKKENFAESKTLAKYKYFRIVKCFERTEEEVVLEE